MSIFSSIFKGICVLADMYKERKKKISKNVILHEDIIYGPDKDIHQLDIYIPKNYSGKIPVFLSVHGGGWVYGDRSVSHPYCQYVCEKGFAVINFNYHLAPKYHFPKPIEDLNYVVDYVLKHKEEYNFDIDNIFLVGESAGAHIAMIYTNICTNEDYAKEFDFKVPEGFSPRALVMNCGMVNAKLAFCNHDLISWFTRHLLCDFYGKKMLEEKEIKRIDPMDNISKNFPHAVFTTGKGDILNYQAKSLEKRLTELNMKHTFKEYGKSGINTPHVFHLSIKNKYAKMCNDFQTSYLKSLILNK
ncbi:acetyl esterase/lipase [Anaeroplasma bactoclasticum]|jgi:acetyl esterase/lipase|uniref:Acetyl esterase/lipase n=1 Tax=Anaeroplasma bactoclasticum TaxID=2088 RepID=A0A397R1Q9_9MOLU|nr:alpha/beta hydrolase [Anaeroplasma bactoclasticum]RIA64104.1 acetyl esterase/lipase [Anaeroplasma bactoclasticum]